MENRLFIVLSPENIPYGPFDSYSAAQDWMMQRPNVVWRIRVLYSPRSI